jgi:hypothetical protein
MSFQYTLQDGRPHSSKGGGISITLEHALYTPALIMRQAIQNNGEYEDRLIWLLHMQSATSTRQCTKHHPIGYTERA